MKFSNGLNSLLRPENSVLVLIDHQPYQLANLNSHDPQAVVASEWQRDWARAETAMFCAERLHRSGRRGRD